MEQSEDSVKSAASSTHSTTSGEHPTFNSIQHSTHHTTHGQSAALEPITEQHESRLSSSSNKSACSGKSSPGNALGNMTCHEIDLTNYTCPDIDEKTEQILSRSIAIDPSDPFDDGLIKKFVSKLKRPLSDYPTYHSFEEAVPEVAPKCPVKLGRGIILHYCQKFNYWFKFIPEIQLRLSLQVMRYMMYSVTWQREGMHRYSRPRRSISVVWILIRMKPKWSRYKSRLVHGSSILCQSCMTDCRSWMLLLMW